MAIPTEQANTISGATNTITLNPDYLYTQVTLYGRNTGNVTGTIRPIMADNNPVNFMADDFEGIDGGLVNLAANPKKRTFTIERKRCSALRLSDDGAGNYKYYINQWGHIGKV